MMREIVEAGIAAVQRIAGVPAIGDRAETRLKCIIEEEPSNKALADLKQFFYDLNRGK